MTFSKKLRIVAVVGLAIAALQGQAPSHSPTLPDGWTLHTVRPGKVYFLYNGTNGNSEVIIGDTGVIVIDTKVDAMSGGQLIKIVADLTPKPITHVVETHGDCDHVNGIVAFPKSVKIIAHVNNYFEQASTLQFGTVEPFGGSGLPPADRPPNVLIDQEKVDTHIDGVHIVFYHFAPAHTSGDLITYLPDEKVVDAGDILMNPIPGPNGAPSQNRGLWWKFEKGGSIAGWFKNADGILALDADAYIPGHGETLFTKADVSKLRADLFSDKQKVDAMAEAGKSVADIQLAFHDEIYPERGLLPKNATAAQNCPRGIRRMPFTWMEYHEWLVRREAFKG